MNMRAYNSAKRRIFNRAAANRPFWSIQNVSDSEAELRLYDEIGFWEDSTAKAFAEQLKAIKANTIHLRINSPGGYIADAMAMYQMLLDHPATIITHIDGICASAATYPALAGDTVEINAGGMFMIHDPLSAVWGNAEQMRQEADALDKFKKAIVAVYERETGNSAAKLADWMKAETWFTADEAVKAGFADKIAGDDALAANRFDLSIFNNTPEQLRANAGQIKTTREFENFLRDVGFSKNEAKAIASGGFESRRDAANESDAIERMATFAATLRAGFITRNARELEK